MKRKRTALASLAAAGFFVIVAIVDTAAFAQRASIPKSQDKVALGEAHVRELLALMDTDKNGKISKQEWMKFMEAEFDRLDKNHDGNLDAKDLSQSRIQVSSRPFAAAGK